MKPVVAQVTPNIEPVNQNSLTYKNIVIYVEYLLIIKRLKQYGACVPFTSILFHFQQLKQQELIGQ